MSKLNEGIEQAQNVNTLKETFLGEGFGYLWIVIKIIRKFWPLGSSSQVCNRELMSKNKDAIIDVVQQIVSKNHGLSTDLRVLVALWTAPEDL